MCVVRELSRTNPEGIPKEFRHIAQGCKATLGICGKTAQPQRGCVSI